MSDRLKRTTVFRLPALAIAAALALPLAAPIAHAGGATEAGRTLDNAALTASIKTQLMADERTKAFDINVDTTGTGYVTLRGTAPSAEARRVAGGIALATKGVTQVENALIVAPKGSVAAASAPPETLSQHAKKAGREVAEGSGEVWLTTKVKTALLADPAVKGLDIKVRSEDDVVTLSGTVPSLAMRARAIEVAAGVEGVARVDTSELRVEAIADKR